MTQNHAHLTVAGVSLSSEIPTRLTYGELYSWVIWQYPRPQNGGLCGAVHPPTPQHGWIPAIIFAGKNTLKYTPILTSNILHRN